MITPTYRSLSGFLGLAAALFLGSSPTALAQHFTTYDLIVPVSATSTVVVVDGAGRIMPANRSFVIGLPGGLRGPIQFTNWRGSAEFPVVIVNQAGTGRVTLTDVVPGSTTYTRRDGISLVNCEHFQLRGDNDPAYRYGIEVAQVGEKAGHSKVGVVVGGTSSNGEIMFVEVHDSGFAGIMAKSDPAANNPATWAANFVMRDIRIHDTYVHDVGGEGMYLGWTSWNTTYTTGTPPVSYQGHEIHGLRVHHNLVERAGWETVQVASNPVDTKLHDNVLYWGGVSPRLAPYFQGSNLAIGGGATGEYFNNVIIKSYYNSISITGPESQISVYNNLLLDAGEYGIFAKNQPDVVPTDPDLRQTIPGSFVNIFNNTIVNATLGGYFTQDEVSVNNFKNNIVVVPDPAAPYIKTEQGAVVQDDGTVVQRTNSGLNFANTAELDYRITAGSSAANAGVALGALPAPEVSVVDDHHGVARPQGGAFDAGYSELGGLSVFLVATPPPAGSGTGSVKASVLGGTAPYTYAWSNGGSTATISGLAAGLYSVLVTDAAGAQVRKGVYLYPGATYGAPVSDVAAANQVLPITLSPAPGTYAGPQTITLSSPTAGDIIRYTTDGSLPTTSRGSSYGGPITIAGTTTLKVIAYKSGMANSEIRVGTYVIENGPTNAKFPLVGSAITESSHQGSTNTKEKTIDGSLSTAWVSHTPITYSPSGAWIPSAVAGAYNNDVHATSATDADVQAVLATCTQMFWYGAVGPNGGIAAVSVDGGAETLVDTYAPVAAQDQLLFSSATLPSAGHTLKVRVTGTKNASSSGYSVSADRFVTSAGTSVNDDQDAQWIRYDLGSSKRVAALKMAFGTGNNGTYRFEIHTSSDDINYTPLVDGRVPGHPTWFLSNRDLLLQDFDIPDVDNVRYVRIVGHGNDNGNKNLQRNNSYAEVEIWGGDAGSALPRGIYQAETATLSGPTVKTNQTGYTGSGFVSFTNASGDYIEWTIANPTTSQRGLTFRYQYGGSPRTVAISVNGVVVEPALSFQGTGAPGVWVDRAVVASLPAGTVTIRMTSTGSSGPNVDSLRID